MFRRGALFLQVLLVALAILCSKSDAAGSAPWVGYRIDSGGMLNFTDNFTREWIRDDGFTSGMAGTLNRTGKLNEFNTPDYQQTTRYYLFALENCYQISIPKGHYLIRMFFNPGPPAVGEDPTRRFQLATLSTQVTSIMPKAPGEFHEMMVTYPDDNADICFVANPQALSAYVNALEILPVDKDSYVSDPNFILFTYARVLLGEKPSFGDGVSLPDHDAKGHRQWFNMSANKLMNAPVDVSCKPSCRYLSAALGEDSIEGADVAPNFFPARLYASAVTASSEVTVTVGGIDKGSRLLVVLHFAEIEDAVTAPGARVFSVSINGKPAKEATNVDVVASSGAPLRAHQRIIDWQLAEGEDTAAVVLTAARKSANGPILSAVEVFRLVGRGPRTNPTEFKTMWTVRDALVVPEMSTWQGDPCAPISWTGVGCQLTPKNEYTVVGISMSGTQLSGQIHPDVHLLPNLKTLNLSNNQLSGKIPQSVVDLEKLTALDLSQNDLSGTIPKGFSTMPSLRILDLHANELTGGVPADLFPPPPGILIDFSNNPDVCGTKTRPACEALGGPGMSDITLVKPVNSNSLSSTQIVWIIAACVLGVLLIVALVVAVRLIFFQPVLDETASEVGFFAQSTPSHHYLRNGDDDNMSRAESTQSRQSENEFVRMQIA
eukprot:TRINITY_DN31544_c0_g1_i1.p1 TRINITY_DN31544_c0_g1~~TRINITY_DN31544_c0_g1_i1.p1  ORF type:complete len:661 (+),score=40.60 TRINITY_DN31544_c0_g1_i1:17-1999(+)